MGSIVTWWRSLPVVLIAARMARDARPYLVRAGSRGVRGVAAMLGVSHGSPRGVFLSHCSDIETETAKVPTAPCDPDRYNRFFARARARRGGPRERRRNALVPVAVFVRIGASRCRSRRHQVTIRLGTHRSCGIFSDFQPPPGNDSARYAHGVSFGRLGG